MRRYLWDLGERVVGAFAAALLAQLPAHGFDVRVWPWGESLGFAGGVAVVVLLGGVVARFRGDPGSAGFVK